MMKSPGLLTASSEHVKRQAPIIEARNVWKHYAAPNGQYAALRGIDLQIHMGEVVALMGPSGCGKSTLVNCLAGLDRPTRGVILFEGQQLHQLSEQRRTRLRAQRMGFVFQAFNLVPVISVLANVCLPLEILGHGRANSAKRAREILASVGLAETSQRMPSELSGGEQQRVAIARAIVASPSVVWADEPTGNLDSEMGERVVDLLRAMNRAHGTTIFLVTHDRAVAEAADRIIKMRSGRIVEG